MNSTDNQHFEELLAVTKATQALGPRVSVLAATMAHQLIEGGKIVWFGNGGSAAEAQHLAAEFVGRFMLEREGLASISLSSDTSALTAIANDYEHVFARQVQSLCRSADVVIGLSTSGTSPNAVNALLQAKRCGAITAALTGESGGKLTEVDYLINVPSSNTARIQEMHLIIGHVICDLVERELAG